MPSMKYLCPMKYRRTGGVMAMHEAAMIDFQSVPNPERKFARACEIVFCSLREM